MKRRNFLKRTSAGFLAVLLCVAMNIEPVGVIAGALCETEFIQDCSILYDNLIYLTKNKINNVHATETGGGTGGESGGGCDCDFDCDFDIGAIRNALAELGGGTNDNGTYSGVTLADLSDAISDAEDAVIDELTAIAEAIMGEDGTSLSDINSTLGTTNTKLDSIDADLDNIYTELQSMHSDLNSKLDTANTWLEKIEKNLGLILSEIEGMTHDYRVAHLHSINNSEKNALWRPYTSDVPYVKDYAYVTGGFANIYTGTWDSFVTPIEKGNPILNVKDKEYAEGAVRAYEVLGYDAVLRREGMLIVGKLAYCDRHGERIYFQFEDTTGLYNIACGDRYFNGQLVCPECLKNLENGVAGTAGISTNQQWQTIIKYVQEPIPYENITWFDAITVLYKALGQEEITYKSFMYHNDNITPANSPAYQNLSNIDGFDGYDFEYVEVWDYIYEYTYAATDLKKETPLDKNQDGVVNNLDMVPVDWNKDGKVDDLDKMVYEVAVDQDDNGIIDVDDKTAIAKKVYQGYDYKVFTSRTNIFTGTIKAVKNDKGEWDDEANGLENARAKAESYDIYWTKALNDGFVLDANKDTPITGQDFFKLCQRMMEAYGEPVLNQDEIDALLQVYGAEYPIQLGTEVADAWAYLKARGCLAVDISYTGTVSRDQLLDVCMRIKDKDSRTDYKNINIVLDLADVMISDGYYPVADLTIAKGDIVATTTYNWAKSEYYDLFIPCHGNSIISGTYKKDGQTLTKRIEKLVVLQESVDDKEPFITKDYLAKNSADEKNAYLKDHGYIDGAYDGIENFDGYEYYHLRIPRPTYSGSDVDSYKKSLYDIKLVAVEEAPEGCTWEGDMNISCIAIPAKHNVGGIITTLTEKDKVWTSTAEPSPFEDRGDDIAYLRYTDASRAGDGEKADGAVVLAPNPTLSEYLCYYWDVLTTPMVVEAADAGGSTSEVKIGINNYTNEEVDLMVNVKDQVGSSYGTDGAQVAAVAKTVDSATAFLYRFATVGENDKLVEKLKEDSTFSTDTMFTDYINFLKTCTIIDGENMGEVSDPLFGNYNGYLSYYSEANTDIGLGIKGYVEFSPTLKVVDDYDNMNQGGYAQHVGTKKKYYYEIDMTKGQWFYKYVLGLSGTELSITPSYRELLIKGAITKFLQAKLTADLKDANRDYANTEYVLVKDGDTWENNAKTILAVDYTESSPIKLNLFDLSYAALGGSVYVNNNDQNHGNGLYGTLRCCNETQGSAIINGIQGFSYKDLCKAIDRDLNKNLWRTALGKTGVTGSYAVPSTADGVRLKAALEPAMKDLSDIANLIRTHEIESIAQDDKGVITIKCGKPDGLAAAIGEVMGERTEYDGGDTLINKQDVSTLLSRSLKTSAIMNRNENILILWEDLLRSGIVIDTFNGRNPEKDVEGTYHIQTSHGLVKVNPGKHTILIGNTLYNLDDNGTGPNLVYIHAGEDTEEGDQFYLDYRCIMGISADNLRFNDQLTTAIKSESSVGVGSSVVYNITDGEVDSKLFSTVGIGSYMFPDVAIMEDSTTGLKTHYTSQVITSTFYDGETLVNNSKSASSTTASYWGGMDSKHRRMTMASFNPISNWLVMIRQTDADTNGYLYVWYPRVAFAEGFRDIDGSIVNGVTDSSGNDKNSWQSLAKGAVADCLVYGGRSFSALWREAYEKDISDEDYEWYDYMTMYASACLYDESQGGYYLSSDYVCRRFEITNSTAIEPVNTAIKDSKFTSSDPGIMYWLEGIGYVYNLPTSGVGEEFTLKKYFEGRVMLPVVFDPDDTYGQIGLINYNVDYYGEINLTNNAGVKTESYKSKYGEVISSKGLVTLNNSYVNSGGDITKERLWGYWKDDAALSKIKATTDAEYPFNIDTSTSGTYVPAPCGMYSLFGGLSDGEDATVGELTGFITAANHVYYGNKRLMFDRSEDDSYYFYLGLGNYPSIEIGSEVQFKRVYHGTYDVLVGFGGNVIADSGGKVAKVDIHDEYANPLKNFLEGWGASSFLEKIDHGASFLILITFKVIPIIGVILITVLVGLSFLGDAKFFRNICDATVDPVSLLTLGRRTIHTWSWRRVLIPCMLLYIAFALFLNGNLIRVIMVLAEWYDVIMTWLETF